MSDFIAQDIDGKLHISPKEDFRNAIKKFAGKKFTIRILNKARSSQSNRYYRVCLKYCSDATGYTPDEWHEFFKSKFLKRKLVVKISGEEVDTLESNYSTAVLSQQQFTEYIDSIRDYASQKLKIYIPTSEEYWDKV